MNRKKTIGIPSPSKPLLPKRVNPIKKGKAIKLSIKNLKKLKIVKNSKNNFSIKL